MEKRVEDDRKQKERREQEDEGWRRTGRKRVSDDRNQKERRKGTRGRRLKEENAEKKSRR